MHRLLYLGGTNPIIGEGLTGDDRPFLFVARKGWWGFQVADLVHEGPLDDLSLGNPASQVGRCFAGWESDGTYEGSFDFEEAHYQMLLCLQEYVQGCLQRIELPLPLDADHAGDP